MIIKKFINFVMIDCFNGLINNNLYNNFSFNVF